MNEPLKSCPFCGYRELSNTRIGAQHWEMRCDTCEAAGPPGKTAEEAREHWQSRTE